MVDQFDLRYGTSIGLGVDTIIGPISLDFALGDGGRQNAYVNIGIPF